MNPETLIPKLGVVTKITKETPDVKTFQVVGPDGKKPFIHIPGQCAMLSIPGVGEALFSITSSPTNNDYLEFSINGFFGDLISSMAALLTFILVTNIIPCGSVRETCFAVLIIAFWLKIVQRKIKKKCEFIPTFLIKPVFYQKQKV